MKKVALVGSAPASEMEAPFGDEEFDIWVLGQRYHLYSRYTRIFEIHTKLDHLGEDYIPRLNSLPDRDKIVGAKTPVEGVKYPYSDVFALGMGDYLTSTLAYMIGLAVLDEYDEIHIYGADMAVSNEEYFHQRPCMEAWIGFARGKGINVVIHPSSPLGKSTYLYGIGDKKNLALAPFTHAELSKFEQLHKDSVARLEAQKEEKLKEHRREIEEINAKITANFAAQEVLGNLSKVARAVEDGNKINSLMDNIRLRG
jgi:hypothetical protein